MEPDGVLGAGAFAAVEVVHEAGLDGIGGTAVVDCFEAVVQCVDAWGVGGAGDECGDEHLGRAIDRHGESPSLWIVEFCDYYGEIGAFVNMGR